MFKTKRAKILYLLLSLLPLIAVACLYSALPEQIPMQWDVKGHINYSDKKMIWVLGALPIVLGLLFQYLPLIDPRKENYAKFADSYKAIAVVVQLFLLTMIGITLTESLRPGTLSVENIVIGLVGLLLVFTGCMLPKIKSTYFIGFRTPWSLSHPDVWDKTQKLGGVCFILTGIVCLALVIAPLTSEIRLLILLIALVITCILPTGMSCYWFQKLPKDQQKQVFVEIKPGERTKPADLSYSKKSSSKPANKNQNHHDKKKKKK